MVELSFAFIIAEIKIATFLNPGGALSNRSRRRRPNPSGHQILSPLHRRLQRPQGSSRSFVEKISRFGRDLHGRALVSVARRVNERSHGGLRAATQVSLSEIQLEDDSGRREGVRGSLRFQHAGRHRSDLAFYGLLCWESQNCRGELQ